jgi:hypothetical protein
MPDAGREDQPITRAKLHITSIVWQGKGNAACQAKQGLAVGMAMDPINVTRAIGPRGGAQAPGLKKGKNLGFRQWMGMGPAKDLHPCGQGFMI